VKIHLVGAASFLADGQTDRQTWRRIESFFTIFRTHPNNTTIFRGQHRSTKNYMYTMCTHDAFVKFLFQRKLNFTNQNCRK